jgi:Co/Zn/Cd efflux system component
MLGDAIVYGFSLYAVVRGPVWRARAALLKGSIMGVFGLGVLAEVIVKAIHGVVPLADVIGGVLLAAAGVGLTDAAWPDITIGLLIAVMFGSSAIAVIRAARGQLRLTPVP